MVSVVTDEAKMYMPLSELVDIEKERQRIEKELSKAKTELERVERSSKTRALYPKRRKMS